MCVQQSLFALVQRALCAQPLKLGVVNELRAHHFIYIYI